MLCYRKKLLITVLLITAFLFLCNHLFQFCTFNPFGAATEKNLCVMTWNVHITDHSFKEKQADIAEEILKQDADILLVNEYSLDDAAELHSLMKEKYPYTIEDYAKALGGDILYSRYPIESSTRIESATLHPLAYEFRLKVNEKTVRIVGCHLSSNNYDKDGHHYTPKKENKFLDLPNYYANYRESKERRTMQAELILDCILSEDLPTIVMGDMNDFSGTSPLNTLQKVGLKDAWWEGGNGFGITFHEDWMHFRLDHILYDANWELSSVKVVQSDLSDHRPLVAEFSMKY